MELWLSSGIASRDATFRGARRPLRRLDMMWNDVHVTLPELLLQPQQGLEPDSVQELCFGQRTPLH